VVAEPPQSTIPAVPKAVWQRWERKLALTAITLYSLLVLAVWGLIRFGGDRWWPATLLMFGPRWVWSLPALVVAPLLAVCQPRLWWTLAIVLLVIAGPVMGFCFPWQKLSPARLDAFHVRVLTCNVHRYQVNPGGLAATIDKTRPDIVVLQDWSSRDAPALGREQQWHTRRDDEMFIASRPALASTEVFRVPEFSEGRGSLVRYDIETAIGPIAFFNVHLNSPRQGFEEVIDRRFRDGDELQKNSELRMRQSSIARQAVDRVAGPMIVAGDFNTPAESTIYRRWWSDLTDAFAAGGLGWGHTYFTRRASMRIDHIVAGPGWTCRRCWVEAPVGSAHRPLVADLEWAASAATER
jgi:endonuclease/exonuclease/phosphatase (EEP) superfamily protein YafD